MVTSRNSFLLNRMRANAAVALLLGLLSSSVADGQPSMSASERAFVVGSSLCPEPAAVAREAVHLTPEKQRSIYQSGVRVEVNDLGERYQVRIYAPDLLVSKAYVDPSRDCARRTTFAAVLVLMTLMPPQLAEDAESGAESGAPPAAGVDPNSGAASASASPDRTNTSRDSTDQRHPDPKSRQREFASGAHTEARRSWARVAFGGGATWAPALADSITTSSWQLSMQASFGPGSLRPMVAMAYAPRSSFELLGIAGTVRRWPAMIGVEWRFETLGLDSAVGVGAVAVLERVQARGLLVSRSQSAVELGARIAFTVASSDSAVTPFFGLAFDWFPEPRAISVAPRGELGTTPAVQIWSHLGMRIGL